MSMMGRIQKLTKESVRSVVTWWVRNDRKYRVKWRVANVFTALLIVSSVVIPVIQTTLTNRRYRLSQDTLNLVGQNNQALASKLTYNPKTQTYEFNKEAIKEYNPVDAMQEQAGGADEKTKSLYALDVPANPKTGVTYHDVNSQLSFKLVPQFSSLPGKTEQGRVVFPLDGGPQAVYTLKNNGLKEDIVVTNGKQNTLRFTYKLELPKSLEAKQLPGGSGAIGIYSADPTLFTNMSYGSDKDRELVEKARENAEKTNLVFGIPAPVISAKDGKLGNAYAHFELRGDQLTVVAENLSSIKGTYSIDPSVVITASSDFTNGNNEGNIDFTTSGQIGRAGLTGGTLGTWGAATANNLTTARSSFASAVYNGFIYVIGGRDTSGNVLQSVEYAKISTSGTLSSNSCGTSTTWCSGGNIGTVVDMNAAVAYNGYLYSFEGRLSTTVIGTDVRYARICDGTITTNGCSAGANNAGKPGTWASANTGAAYSSRFGHAAVAYNGFVYVLGGCTSDYNGIITGNCFALDNSIYRATVQGDGKLGAWSAVTPATSFSARFSHSSAIYNGFMYVLGGCTAVNGSNNCSAITNDVSYAKINSDGSINNWASTNTFTTARTNLVANAYNGYMYIVNGCTISDNARCVNGSGTVINDVQYAQIYANGTLGPWNTTSTLAAGRAAHGSILSDGYIFTVGGCTSSTCTGANILGSTQSAKIDSPGTINSFKTNPNNITVSGGSFGAATAIYGGYMYLLGGGDTTSNNFTNRVLFAKLNSDGTTGTWTTTSTFTDARVNPAATAYNGFMYIAGGAAQSATANCPTITSSNYCTDIQKAQINSDGTLGTWSSAGGAYAGTGNTGRDGLGMTTYNGYIYVIGGNYNNNSNITPEVDVAPINSNGNVGTWVQNTTAMGSNERSNFQLAQYGKYIYIAGGRRAGNITISSVVYATLSPSGGMSAWASAGSDFTTARTGNFAAVNNGYLYITGGFPGTTGNTGFGDVQYAKLDVSSGALSGGWTTSSVTLPTPRTRQGGGIYNGYIYVAGGCSNNALFGGCNTLQNDVQVALINNGGGGHANAFSSKGNFTTARSQTTATAYNGYIYVSGGCTSITSVTMNGCASSTNDTRYASIAADGTLTWSSLDSNPTTNRYGHATVAYSGYLYVIGGCSSTGGTNGFCTSVLSDVQRIKLNNDGNTTGSSWASAGNNISTARFGISAVTYNGYIYVLGGCSAMASGNCTTFESSVEYAQIDSNGNVGAWATTGGSGFAIGRYQQGAVAYGGYMYVAGGCSAMTSANCTAFQNDIQYAAINTNGTISSTWDTAPNFDIPRFGASLSARNGYLYLTGGCAANTSGNCTAFQLDIQSAPINTTGMVGSWSGLSNQFTDARYMHSTVITNGYLYVLGGIKTGATQLNDSQGAVLQLQPRIGRYSKLIDLSRENAKINNITYNGSLSDNIGNITLKVASTSSPTFSSSYNDPAVPDTGCSSGLAAVRVKYVLVTIVLDDMSGGTSGGTYGETSTAGVTDFTLRYNFIHPDPNIRLRHGQTLQENDGLSPLDTCI